MIAEVQAMLRHLCFWTVSSFSSVHFMWCLWSRHLFHENGDRYLGMLQPSVGLVQDNNSTSLESFDFTFWCSCQCCGHESLMFGKVYLHSYGISLKVFQGLQTKNILNQLNIFLWFWACSSLNCASWGCSNHLIWMPLCVWVAKSVNRDASIAVSYFEVQGNWRQGFFQDSLEVSPLIGLTGLKLLPPGYGCPLFLCSDFRAGTGFLLFLVCFEVEALYVGLGAF